MSILGRLWVSYQELIGSTRYWDINSIKVYQLAPPSSTLTTIGIPSSTLTGTLSYDTAPGAWSAWSSDAVTYGLSSTSSVPLTTASAQYSLLLPAMGWPGTISAGGTVYSETTTTSGTTTPSSTVSAQNYSATGTGTGASASPQSVGPLAYGTQAAAFTGAAAMSSASVSIMGTVVMAIIGLVFML